MNSENLLKIKNTIAKLIALGESESALGNEGAAASIAEKVQDLMQKYHFEQDEFQAAHPEIEYQPLIGFSIMENPFLSKRPTEWRKPRIEFLASCIASGYYCKVLVNYRFGQLKFYGIDFDRDIAMLMFEKLTNMAIESCKIEMDKAKKLVGKTGMDIQTMKVVIYPKVWMGDDVFADSFMLGFGSKLKENYKKNQQENAFDRIDEFIKLDLSSNQFVLADSFYPNSENEIVVETGRRYGNFTAKNKANKVQKSASLEVSKAIKHEQINDDRIGEVILVLDDSGSMSGEKCKLAAEGAKDFALDAINKKFAVGAIKFGSEAHFLFSPKLELNGEFNAAINQLYGSSGGTSMFPAIKLAAESFSKKPQKRIILIATDGKPTDDPQASINYANLLKASGIQIFTVGTYDADEEFLKAISSGDKTLQVSDGEIRNALKGMAGSLTA